MPTSSLALRPVLSCAPSNIAKVSYLSASGKHHQNPLVHRIHNHNTLAFLVFLNGLSHPSRWPFFLSIVNGGTKWNVGVTGVSPIAGQSVKIIRSRMRARIEVEMKFGIQLLKQIGWSQPVVFPITTVAFMELVRVRMKCCAHVSIELNIPGILALALARL